LMAPRFFFLLSLCVLPAALVSATRPVRTPFVVQGRVFCDTCKAGFETPATTYIQGAKVRLECKNRDTQQVVFSCDSVTDHTGTFEINVAYDHGDEICEALVVSSPQKGCQSVLPGREKSRVILTNYNGISSNVRFANSMGFVQKEAASGCAQIMKLYEEEDV
ncbi:pollen Ole e 1 allergen/extensin family protein, partial [Ralstonia pseudosolanacearum]|uniref:pollen Ole e 1 allergen/extensin family protein n=1 Tax=Ralstonia pseudosolanacearum TaxID=1310165 RepID=UPI003D17D0F9